MRILITGHKGFVGRNVIKSIKRMVDRDNIEIVGIDIKDGKDCRDFFKTDRSYFDIVIHLAAIVGGRMTIEGNPLSVATDLSIDAEMFQWALLTKPGKIVYFSSSAAYPTSLQKEPHRGLHEGCIDLHRIANPDMTYGWAKLTGEYLARFAIEAGLKVYVFRPFSGYGSDQDLDYPFPTYVKRAAERKDPFEIWGDGLQVRDFIHIEDIVEAMWAVLKHPEGHLYPVNLCTGRPTNFIQLADYCCNLAGYEPSAKLFLGEKPVGVQYRLGNPDYMLKFYKPKISLEDGIRRALSENHSI